MSAAREENLSLKKIKHNLFPSQFPCLLPQARRDCGGFPQLPTEHSHASPAHTVFSGVEMSRKEDKMGQFCRHPEKKVEKHAFHFQRD